MKIIVSLTATDLESFRRYRDEEEMSLEELIRRIRREEPATEIMRAGSALHAILEHAHEQDLVVAERDGHRFLFDSLDAEIPLMAHREIHGKKTFIVDGEEIEVRAKCDELQGITIGEHKISKSAFDAERYLDSYQWRLYLSIFNASICFYNVFQVTPEEVVDGVSVWKVRDFNRLPLYRYPELEQDIKREISLYLQFAKKHLIGAPSRAA